MLFFSSTLYFCLEKESSTNCWKFGDSEFQLSLALCFQGLPCFNENMPKGMIIGIETT